jgi:hypothetical protein
VSVASRAARDPNAAGDENVLVAEVSEAFHLTTEEIIGLIRNCFASSFNGAKYLEHLDSWLEARGS